MWIKKLKRYYHTLKDVGFKRILLRIFYEFNKKIDNNLNEFFLKRIYRLRNKKIKWDPVFEFSSELKFSNKYPKYLEFNFLNIKQKLTIPFRWDTYKPRLWKWNLHYFNWMLDWLDLYCEKKKTNNLFLLGEIYDDWISKSPIGRGDAWHSYIISMRLRNIIWVLTLFPELKSNNRINSLWTQMCWLNTHKENHHGGNHYLENLIALSFCSLHFEGHKARSIFSQTQLELTKELKLQILDDGGHEERTPSYHLLLLEHLTELALTIQKKLGDRPEWLVTHIYKMTRWSEKIRLIGGKFPNFNDATTSSCSPLDEVLKYALSYLNQETHKLYGLKNFQVRNLKFTNVNSIKQGDSLSDNYLMNYDQKFKSPLITDLPDTGWTILRPGHKYELVFKCGTPCPKHLGAHVHSDLLSFDFLYDSIPLIAETGVSTYEKGLERNYQRSCSAHNTLQLGQNLGKGKINWIEPVDTWHAFRAGKKANPRNRRYENFKDLLIVNGGHNAFEEIGSHFERFIALKVISDQFPILIIIDTINSTQMNNFRSFFHLIPKKKKKNEVKELSFISLSSNIFRTEVKDGYFCNDFGIRKPSKTTIYNGNIKKGKTKLITVFIDEQYVKLISSNKNRKKLLNFINISEESKNLLSEYEINKKFIFDFFLNLDF